VTCVLLPTWLMTFWIKNFDTKVLRIYSTILIYAWSYQ